MNFKYAFGQFKRIILNITVCIVEDSLHPTSYNIVFDSLILLLHDMGFLIQMPAHACYGYALISVVLFCVSMLSLSRTD